jgi:hypothetical protein
MTTRPSSSLKIDLQRTPQRSGAKQDNIMLSQSKPNPNSEPRSELPRPELSMRRQEPAQPAFEIPPRAQTPAFNFITMGRFQLDSTITRAWICNRVLLLTIKILSMLTAAVFWLAFPFYIKTLLSWKAPLNIFYDIIDSYTSGLPSTTPIWRRLFPATDYTGHQLRLIVHQSSYLHSQTFYSASIPLILDNPLVWLFVMTLMFASHHLLCFAHDCVSKVSSTIRPAN